MKQLIEDLISALEYHVEQTRPIYSTTVALQAAREALKSLPPQRTWDELTLAEVKEAYVQHAKYQIEDMGASGWVEFADALQTILRNKNT